MQEFFGVHARKKYCWKVEKISSQKNNFSLKNAGTKGIKKRKNLFQKHEKLFTKLTYKKTHKQRKKLQFMKLNQTFIILAVLRRSV